MVDVASFYRSGGDWAWRGRNKRGRATTLLVAGKKYSKAGCEFILEYIPGDVVVLRVIVCD